MKVKAKETVVQQLIDASLGPYLSPGKCYVVIGVDDASYRVINDLGEPCLYPKLVFEILDPNLPPDWLSYKFEDEDGEELYYLGPPEFALPDFYEKLFDREPEALAVFDTFKKQHGLDEKQSSSQTAGNLEYFTNYKNSHTCDYLEKLADDPFFKMNVLQDATNWILLSRSYATDYDVRAGEAEYVGELMSNYSIGILFCPFCGKQLNPP